MRLVLLLLLFFFKNLLLIFTICDIKMIFDVHSYHYRRAIGHFSHRAETDRSVQDLVLFQMLIFCSFSRRETPGSSRTHYSHEQVVRLYIPDTIIHCRIRAHRRQWQNGRKSFGRKKKKKAAGLSRLRRAEECSNSWKQSWTRNKGRESLLSSPPLFLTPSYTSRA